MTSKLYDRERDGDYEPEPEPVWETPRGWQEVSAEEFMALMPPSTAKPGEARYVDEYGQNVYVQSGLQGFAKATADLLRGGVRDGDGRIRPFSLDTTPPIPAGHVLVGNVDPLKEPELITWEEFERQHTARAVHYNWPSNPNWPTYDEALHGPVEKPIPDKPESLVLITGVVALFLLAGLAFLVLFS